MAENLTPKQYRALESPFTDGDVTAAKRLVRKIGGQLYSGNGKQIVTPWRGDLIVTTWVVRAKGTDDGLLE
jgi:hypothetical protein